MTQVRQWILNCLRWWRPRRPGELPRDAVGVSSVDYWTLAPGAGRVAVIGGGEVYRALLPLRRRVEQMAGRVAEPGRAPQERTVTVRFQTFMRPQSSRLTR